jgi:NADH-quinone oxidoreductase subunit J
MSHLNNMLPAVWFYLFAAVAVVSALCVVGLKNVVHCAMFLASTFLAVAAVYLLLNAEFIAVVQVLIYVGAVTVLILFAIMLSQKYTGVELKQHNSQSFPAAVMIGVFLFTLIGVLFREWSSVKAPAEIAHGSAQVIGDLLMRPYVLPFEVASLLLLAAMIGAIVIARKEEP